MSLIKIICVILSSHPIPYDSSSLAIHHRSFGVVVIGYESVCIVCSVCFSEAWNGSRRYSHLEQLLTSAKPSCIRFISSLQISEYIENEFRGSRRWFGELQAITVSLIQPHIFPHSTHSLVIDWIVLAGIFLDWIANLIMYFQAWAR